MKKSLLLLVLFSLIQMKSYAQNPCPNLPTIEYGGQTYHTVQIGDQCWLKENLNIGTRVNGRVNQDAANGTIEKYCYNDDEANCSKYGGLYQWKEAMKNSANAGTQGICPTGWHIPTTDWRIPTTNEFTILSTSVNNDGNSLKEIGQGADGGSGTNKSGFSALLAGIRYLTGDFYNLDTSAYFWSSTEYFPSTAGNMFLWANGNYVIVNDHQKEDGFSVRCVNDVLVSVLPSELNTLPPKFDLAQNFPNPFNPSTSIKYQISEFCYVTLKVFDVLGNEIETLINEEKLAGNYEITFNGTALSSGVYYYQLKAGNFIDTKKFELIK